MYGGPGTWPAVPTSVRGNKRMSEEGAPGPLYGREHEAGLLRDLVARTDERTGGALVVRGDAGIGKSALLAEISRHAGQHGSRVLSWTGFEQESRLPFAGLHQLLQPLLPLAGQLPPRQHRCLL